MAEDSPDLSHPRSAPLRRRVCNRFLGCCALPAEFYRVMGLEELRWPRLRFRQTVPKKSSRLPQGHPGDGVHRADRRFAGISHSAALLLCERMPPQGGATGHYILHLWGSHRHGDRLHHFRHKVRGSRLRGRLVHGRGHRWDGPDLHCWDHECAAAYGPMNGTGIAP